MSSGISKIIASQNFRLSAVRGRLSVQRTRSRLCSTLVGSNQPTKSYSSHRPKSTAAAAGTNRYNHRAWFYSESFKNYRSSSSTWVPSASAVPVSSSFHQESEWDEDDDYDFDGVSHQFDDSSLEDDLDWELKQLNQDNLSQFLPPPPLPSPSSSRATSSILTPRRILRKLSGVEETNTTRTARKRTTASTNWREQEDRSFQYNDSLSLELGEASVWDQPQSFSSEQEEEFDSDGYTVEEHHPPTRNKLPTAVDILLKFDPQNPPATNDPLELQMWLECEAQQEAVSRYQHIRDQARQRQDYSGPLQQYLLQWFDQG